MEPMRKYNRRQDHSKRQQGFTLLEAAVSLVILMIIGLGVASLFTYAIRANTGADDRELSMAVAQMRMEWLRTIPFTMQTRSVAYAFPSGGLAATTADGVNETITSAGRSYTVNTLIEDLSFVPTGQPDAGAPTLKRIRVSVTPFGATTGFETVTVYTERSTQVTGTY